MLLRDRDEEARERRSDSKLLPENLEEEEGGSEAKFEEGLKLVDDSIAAKGKRFLKSISAGGVENGIYFKKNKQYFSLITGCISLIGGIVILSAAIKIYLDIFNEKVIAPTV